jgi:hypothetical protein
VEKAWVVVAVVAAMARIDVVFFIFFLWYIIFLVCLSFGLSEQNTAVIRSKRAVDSCYYEEQN